jgi:hypothetical protein
MGNDPANGVDPTGGWVDPPTKHLPGRLYRSRDAAAWAWAKQYAKYSLNNNVELSSAIYEYRYEGKIYYGYTPAQQGIIPSERYRQSPGPQHYMKQYKKESGLWDKSDLVPKGAKIVGHIHSHGGENSNAANRFFSDGAKGDMEQMKRFPSLVFYLVTFRGELRRREKNDNKEGILIVSGMYRGKNAKSGVTNEGKGDPNGFVEAGNREASPLENRILIGNASRAAVMTDQQAVQFIPNLLQFTSTAMTISSMASTLAAKGNVVRSLACPIL